jgi:hypothetical protein
VIDDAAAKDLGAANDDTVACGVGDAAGGVPSAAALADADDPVAGLASPVGAVCTAAVAFAAARCAPVAADPSELLVVADRVILGRLVELGAPAEPAAVGVDDETPLPALDGAVLDDVAVPWWVAESGVDVVVDDAADAVAVDAGKLPPLADTVLVGDSCSEDPDGEEDEDAVDDPVAAVVLAAEADEEAPDPVPDADPAVLLLEEDGEPPASPSAWAIPDPLARAAPMPRVTAPAPSQV